MKVKLFQFPVLRPSVQLATLDVAEDLYLKGSDKQIVASILKVKEFPGTLGSFLVKESQSSVDCRHLNVENLSIAFFSVR